MGKAPAFQFYPGDWQRDAALQSCSIAARGLWMEMLCIMHQSEPYGYLKINGKSVEIATLSRLVGASQREAKTLLIELENAGVFQRDQEGAIYSKRMVKDEQTRQARAAGGKKGGNPRLTSKVIPEVGSKVNLDANLPPTPSSSSSSSLSPNPLLASVEGDSLDGLIVPQNMNSELGRQVLSVYIARLRQNRFDPFAAQATLLHLANYSSRKAIGLVQEWIESKRFKPSYEVNWETYAPAEDAIPRPAIVFNRNPRGLDIPGRESA